MKSLKTPKWYNVIRGRNWKDKHRMVNLNGQRDFGQPKSTQKTN